MFATFPESVTKALNIVWMRQQQLAVNNINMDGNILIRPDSKAPLISLYNNRLLLFSAAESVDPKQGMNSLISVNNGTMYLQPTLKERKTMNTYLKLELMQVPTTWKEKCRE